MESNIQIIEKPDWVSWDDIHNVLWEAHAENREKGINMAFPALPGDRIRDKIVGHGKLFVAIEYGTRIAGIGAILVKKSNNLWFWKDKYAYCCFDAILPKNKGQGVYKQIEIRQEEESRAMGINLMMFDTHERNRRMIEISKKNGYKPIDIKVCKDHYNVVMVKWLDGCPYFDFYCKFQFLIHKWYRKLRYKPGQGKRFGI